MSVISKHMLWIEFMSTSFEIVLRWIPYNTVDDKVNVGSDNGSMPSGIKPLSEPMYIQSCVTIWHHEASMS